MLPLKKSILYIQLGYDRSSPRDIRTANMVEYLRKEYEITILALKYPYKRKEIKGINVIRLPFSFVSTYIFNKTESGYKPKGLTKIISRGISFIGNSLFGFPDPWVWDKKNIKNCIVEKIEPTDFIICSMIPFSAGMMASELIQRPEWKHSKLVLDIGDPLAHNAIKTKATKKAMKYENHILQSSELVVVTNVLTAEHYNKTYNIPISKIQVIPQGVDLERFTNKKEIQKERNKIEFMYAGALYKNLRDPSNLFDVISRAEFNPKLEFTFFSEVDNFIQNKTIKNINIKERVTQSELILSYQKADVLLIIDNAYGMQTSGKIYELLSFEKPILLIYSNIESLVYQEIKNFSNVYTCLNSKKELINFFNHFDVSELKEDINYDRKAYSWGARAQKLSRKLKNIE